MNIQLCKHFIKLFRIKKFKPVTFVVGNLWPIKKKNPRVTPKSDAMVLSKIQACEIYKWKHSLQLKSANCKSILLASRYNVSPKTIRDIWNRRTWVVATRSLWSPSEVNLLTR